MASERSRHPSGAALAGLVLGFVMGWELPSTIAAHPAATRVLAGMQATMGAGAALMILRGAEAHAREVGTQLKTAIDRAAEGWVLGFLEAHYPGESFLAEERHADAAEEWQAPHCYWTVDALDGTRSFVDGYPGFCVQVGFVDSAGPLLGVVFEPVAGTVYVALRGSGAWRRTRSEAWTRLRLTASTDWPERPRFVDSTFPHGEVGELLRLRRGCLIECGSIGLKICRVADGSADVFMKELAFKLWDVAPGEVILREAGGVLGTWDGKAVDYASGKIVWHKILATSPALFADAVATVAARRA